MEFFSTTEELLVACYVFFVQALNIIAFLISAFYQKKFGKSSPYLGFLLSHLLGGVFIGTMLVAEDSNTVGIIRTTALIGCSMSTTLSVIGLFVAMRTTK